MSPLQRSLSVLPFLAGCALFWVVSGMSRPPVPEAMLFKFSDKLMHAAAYAGLAGLAAIAGRDQAARRLFVLALAMAAGYGIIDEIHQSFVEGRSATVSDVIADTVGAALGARFAVGLRARWRWLGTAAWRAQEPSRRAPDHAS